MMKFDDIIDKAFVKTTNKLYDMDSDVMEWEYKDDSKRICGIVAGPKEAVVLYPEDKNGIHNGILCIRRNGITVESVGEEDWKEYLKQYGGRWHALFERISKEYDRKGDTMAVVRKKLGI